MQVVISKPFIKSTIGYWGQFIIAIIAAVIKFFFNIDVYTISIIASFTAGVINFYYQLQSKHSISDSLSNSFFKIGKLFTLIMALLIAILDPIHNCIDMLLWVTAAYLLIYLFQKPPK